jgi:hypothetical protein
MSLRWWAAWSDDTLLVERTRREEYRERFGFRPGDTVVFVTSTWGPQILFQHMGDVFLAEARRLQDQFHFMLSAHPFEYRPSKPNRRNRGEYLRTQARNGFLVREPSES